MIQRLPKSSKAYFLFFLTMLFVLQVKSQTAFTQGNIAVFVATSSTSNTTGSIVEFSTTGSGVVTHSIPDAVSISSGLRFSGSATSTGYLANSNDGTLLCFNGANNANTSSNVNTLNPRGAGTFNFSGTYNLATTYTGASGNQTRCATTLNNSNWFIADQGGIYTNGSASPSPSGNFRGIKSFAGIVYAGQASSTSSNIQVSTISAASGGTATGLPGLTNNANLQDFYLISSGTNGNTYDVLYVISATSNTAGTITKFSLVSGSWVANGSFTTTFGGFGLAAQKQGNGAFLFVSTGQGALANNSVLRLTDAAGYNAAISINTANNVTLYTASGGAIVKGVAFAPRQAMRITEYMYSGANAATGNGEFIEFTNIGNEAIDMSGWSYDDDSRIAGTVSLSAFGIVQPGESVILTESDAGTFRTAWGLCSGIKIIGNLTTNLGRDDEINLFDASNNLVDRLSYGDDINFPGTIRTQNRSGWVNAAGLGANTISQWTLSSVADAEASVTSAGGDIGSPGKSTRANVSYNPCGIVNGAPTIVMNVASTTDFLDGGVSTSPASPYTISGVISDPTDPASTLGIDFTVNDVETDANSLVVTATTSNTSVVPNANVIVNGSGATRNVKITPSGVGYSTITVTVSDGTNTASYVLNYAASAASATPAATLWHTGMSDASDAIALDDNYYVTGDDELDVLNVYSRSASGLPVASYNYSTLLSLPDPSKPEVDVEAATKSTANANRIYWLGSMSNGKDPFDNKPNRDRLFATAVTGTGASTSFSVIGYGAIRSSLITWGDANGYNFSASAAAGVDSKSPAGFAAEGMVFAPDNTTLYIGMRAPLVPTASRTKAVIAPILNFETWFNNGAPSGNPTYGSPIELDLGLRGIRDLIRLSNGTYIIVAGNPGSTLSPALYKWTGNANDAPILVTNSFPDNPNMEGAMQINENGNLSLTKLQIICDGGNDILYNDGTEAKDFNALNLRKFRSDKLSNLVLCLPTTGDTTAVACNSFSWYGTEYTESGTATHTFTNAQGCDSVVTLHLTINRSSTGDTTAVACNSFNWYGTEYTESGTATHTFINAQGCDSVVTLHLTINHSSTGDTTAVACNSFNWYGTEYTESGTATNTFTNAQGCDSVVTLHLTINRSSTGDTTAVACNSFNWYGTEYTESGTATHTFTNAQGCDSVVTLHLTINHSSTGDTTAVACNSFSWYGTEYTESGTGTHTFTNEQGCDSVVTLHLTINHSSTSTTNVTVCSNDLPYHWNGNDYNAAGTYTYTTTNAAGCDSVATLILTVNESPVASANAGIINCNGGTTTVTVSATGGTLPYTGTGSFTVSAGSYNYTVTDANSCSSSTSITVAQPDAITIDVITGTISCYGGTTSATINAAGGTAPYKYILDNRNPKTSNVYSSLRAGSYFITVTDRKGCSQSKSFDITQPTKVKLIVLQKIKPSCKGGSDGSMQFSAAGGVGAPYEYSLNNGAFTTNSTFTNLQTGTYTVSVRDANGCTTTTSVSLGDGRGRCTQIIASNQQTISALPKILPLSIKILPNPSTTSFTLIAQSVNDEDIQIIVTDMYGKKVYITHGSVNQQYIFGNNFTSGVYFVQVIQGKNIQTLKIIKGRG